MGETGAEGRANTKLFSDCVSKLGWRQRGRIDTDVGCSLCRPRANGAPKTHGVDALFTFPCPVSRTLRAVLVDGKRWSWATMEGPKKLESTLRKVIDDACHIRVSPDHLRSALGVEEPVVLDTALLAWHCHEGWNAAAAKAWLRKVHPGDYRKPAMTALVATNDHLHRLVQIANFVDKYSEVEFCYPEIDSFAQWSTVLTPERLFSRVIPVRYRRTPAEAWTTGALYFDVDSPSHVRFMMKFLREAGYANVSNITVWIPCPVNQLDGFQSEVEAFLRTKGDEAQLAWPGVSLPSVTVHHLTPAEFLS